MADGGEDLLGGTLTVFAQTLVSAEADARCGAEYNARSNCCNGYQGRRWDTRVGAIPLAIP